MAKLINKLPNNISKKFSIKNESLIKTVKDKNVDRIEIEIGDTKQVDFKPQYKFKRWDNEINFSIRAKEDVSSEMEIDDNGKIKYKANKRNVNMYEVNDGTEEGGFSFETELLEKPDSNILEFTINSKNLDFFYQPELTQEQIDNGENRPDNVIGSYAVYHKTKRDNFIGGKNYKTGKAFHMFRPQAIDSNGDWVWCEYNKNLKETNILIITIPQDFLDKATYPIKVK